MSLAKYKTPQNFAEKNSFIFRLLVKWRDFTKKVLQNFAKIDDIVPIILPQDKKKSVRLKP